MANKRNDIVEEQRRARQEFLKLKQMQNGEIEPEAKPSEIAVMPTTFGEKLKNYWYHYKFHTIMAAFVAFLIAFVSVQCATREKYDISIMYFSYTPAAPAQITRAEAYFEKIAEDVDGNGEVNVKVMDCSFNSELRDMQYKHAAFSKVQAVLSAEASTVLYLVDAPAREYFDNALEMNIFKGDLIKMGDAFYKETAKENLTFPKDLTLGLRVIEGTAFAGKEEAEKAFASAEKLYEKVKKQNG